MAITEMVSNEVLNSVKYRAGIFYSDEMRDEDVKSQIRSCQQYLKNAGIQDFALQTDLAVSAYALWYKMQLGTNTLDFTGHPALISIILQLRGEVQKEETSDA